MNKKEQNIEQAENSALNIADVINCPDDYSTISIIVEVEGITESLGYFNTNEVDKVVNLILSY